MEFNIKKGNHRSRWFPKFTTKKVLIGKITFIGDFSYDIGSKHQKDSNKICGLSDNFSHHQDSIRLGWFWDSIINKIAIVGIHYKNGKRSIKRITSVEANKEYSFTISIDKNCYLASFNGEYLLFERSSKWNFLRYYLFPYFGGKERAVKDFKILINTY